MPCMAGACARAMYYSSYLLLVPVQLLVATNISADAEPMGSISSHWSVVLRTEYVLYQHPFSRAPVVLTSLNDNILLLEFDVDLVVLQDPEIGGRV